MAKDRCPKCGGKPEWDEGSGLWRCPDPCGWGHIKACLVEGSDEDARTIAHLNDLIVDLKAALRACILTGRRSVRQPSDIDEDESTISWTPDVQRWAALCGLDLTRHDPPSPR